MSAHVGIRLESVAAPKRPRPHSDLMLSAGDRGGPAWPDGFKLTDPALAVALAKSLSRRGLAVSVLDLDRTDGITPAWVDLDDLTDEQRADAEVWIEQLSGRA